MTGQPPGGDSAGRPLRVLLVTIPLPTREQPNTMAALAHQVQSLRTLGVDVEVLEIRGIPKFKYFQALPRLRKRAKRVDIVHAHFGYCGWLARCQWTRPVVVSFMGDDLLGTATASGRLTRLSRAVVRVNRWLATTIDAVIVKSQEMADVVHPLQVHVVPNGVDLELFRPMDGSQAREALGWSNKPRRVLFPGNPNNPNKGFPLARQAVSRAAAVLGEQLALVPLKDVPPELVPIYMNACDAMVLTSFTEGSPNVVKEAMACNLPVVSVPVGDVPELFAGVSGYCLSPREPEALAAALVGMLRTATRARGRDALKEKGLDILDVGRRLVGIYESVLERRQDERLGGVEGTGTAVRSS